MTVRATIIADTMGEHGARITTFEVYAPRFLLAEINTHRVIAKSAASSRAIPVAKRIEMVEADPYEPAAFGRNKPGMQASEPLAEAEQQEALTLWRYACAAATAAARGLVAIEAHKQHANRLLETWAHFTGVLTATEWDNFWWLRVSPDAQPEFNELAMTMKTLYDHGSPVRTNMHLPYVSEEDKDQLSIADRLYVSAARCARVSYRTFDGKPSTLVADLDLCKKLVVSGHLSPFDHPAYADSVEIREDGAFWADPDAHRQFWGWIPYRVDIEHQIGRRGRRNSHARLF